MGNDHGEVGERAFADVRDGEDYVSLSDLAERPLDPGLFYGVRRLSDARGVDEAEKNPVKIDRLFDRVAGRPRDVGYYGPVLSQQGVQQSAFPGIGGTGYCRRHAVAYRISEAERIGERGDLCKGLCNESGKFIAVGELYIFFAEIEFQLHQRSGFQQFGPELLQLRGEAAAELIEGCSVRGFRRCRNEVGDRFGLCEVHLS